MASNQPEFPTPIRMSGRLFWRRSELEAYKRRIIAFATGETIATDGETPAVESFVSSEQVAKEFGIGRRTLGRIAGRTIGEAA